MTTEWTTALMKTARMVTVCMRHSQRSEMTYSYEYGEITFASVSDRETIDGLIHVRIAGRCIAPLN